MPERPKCLRFQAFNRSFLLISRAEQRIMRASSFHPKKTDGLAECDNTQLDLFDHSVSDHAAAARLLCSHHAPKARCMMNARENRGLAIAAQAEITRQGNVWIVPSQTRLCN